jgi:hypothetical protein
MSFGWTKIEIITIIDHKIMTYLADNPNYPIWSCKMATLCQKLLHLILSNGVEYGILKWTSYWRLMTLLIRCVETVGF